VINPKYSSALGNALDERGMCGIGKCCAYGLHCSYIVLSADLCERGYKRVHLPSSAPLVFVSNKFADNGASVAVGFAIN